MDQKTSILIENQVPEFVRDDYPLFVDFLKAYYEFLETKQGIQLNDLITQSKNLSKIFDVDQSIDEFKVQFYNTYAKFFPLDSNIDSAFLIKNILPLYKSKGSEESFKLLFKLLFGVSVDIFYPRERILIASDGKWVVENTLKISTNLSSYYYGDGNTAEFTILQCKCPITSEVLYRQLNVYVDNVLQTEGIDYYILKEYYKIIFNTIPLENSYIQIFYENVDSSLLVNRKIIGKDSGASVISESITSRILNNRIIYEIVVDAKSLVGQFKVGEQLLTEVFINGTLVNVLLNSISELKEIQIINSGSNYNVGDLVIINSPDSSVAPKAIISKVAKGGIKLINILDGGAGFQLSGRVYVNGFQLPFVDISISSLLTNSIFPVFTANTFDVFGNIIESIDIANTTIDSEYVGFGVSANANSALLNVLTANTFTNIGQISGLDINSVTLTITDEPIISAEPANITISNNTISILSFGSVGKLEILNSGENYSVGDELIFTNSPDNWGYGAFGEITEVNESGGITKIELVPDKIAGTANVQANSITIIGSSTYFERDLTIGNQIRINNEIRNVIEISSNTSLNVDSTFSSTANNKVIRLYGTTLLGGQGYEQNKLPTVTISSLTGSNGNIEVVCLMGNGDAYSTIYENKAYGAVEEISILNHGSGIITIPEIDLTKSGDGLAVASPILINTYEEYPGKWINDDGRISSYNIRLQDRDYYNRHSYVLSSTIEFSKYKEIVKNLLHPVGMKLYAELKMEDLINNPYVYLESEIIQE